MDYQVRNRNFKRKRVGGRGSKRSLSELIDIGAILKSVFVIGILGALIFVIGYAYRGGKTAVTSMSKTAVKAVAERTGDSMNKDIMGNTNVLLVGYAGEEERGGLLTDTVMVASFNAEDESVTFLSIPRDLYVTYHRGRRGKLNGVYRAKYLDSDGDKEDSAGYLREKVGEITGLDIPYHIFVDFDGFIEYVDLIGGVTVDVPDDLVDPYYPADNNEYQTFTVSRGIQTMDGDTALKYARSRMTTSDFSRTLRQQQIIKGILAKITSQLSLSNVGKLKTLANEAFEFVYTNISTREILGLITYLDLEIDFFSFVYTADCDKRFLESAAPGCLLVNGLKENYNGQSVLLPKGATPGNINYYKHTKDFAFRVVHNQEFLKEGARIEIINGIDKDWAKLNNLSVEGVATKLAIELKSQGFTVTGVSNGTNTYDKSLVVTLDEEEYVHTLEILDIFVDVEKVVSGIYSEGEILNGEQLILQDNHSDLNFTIILGNDYLKKQ